MENYEIDLYGAMREYLELRIKAADKMAVNSFVDGYKLALAEALCYMAILRGINTERKERSKE